MTANRRRFARVSVDIPAWIETAGGRWPVTVIDLSFKGALVRAPETCSVTVGMACEMGLVNADDMSRADKAFVRMVCEVRHTDGSLVRLACLELDPASLEQLREMFATDLGDPVIGETIQYEAE